MLSISGVYAEDIDVDSSVVAESPISADVDTSLSSCDAFNNDLSNIYEPSDSSDSYESFDSYNCYESSNVPQINNEISCANDNSYGYYGSYDMSVIDVDYKMDSCESVDVPVVDVGYAYYDASNYCGFEDGILTNDVNQENMDYGTLKMPVIGICDEDGEIESAIEVVEDNVIINDYNSCSKNLLENINIPVLAIENLNLHDGVDENIADAIISEVTSYVETSESYKLIRNVNQADNLLKFENVDAMLAMNVSSIPNASEPVFDGILRTSEYISDVGEVYFGILSKADNEKFLKSVGSENTLLFASMANWYSDMTYTMLQELANHEQSYENILDISTVTKALLKYYPRTNELHIYRLISDNEDEQSHVINDNSHGLDYAHAKHVKVTNKDMPNLMVLTSFGVVFFNEQSTAGYWDVLNDTLFDRISGETLLPDYNAIWTPLLLLIQQDSDESNVNGHTDKDKNKKKNTNKNKNSTNKTNSSTNNTHWHGFEHYYYDDWGYSEYCYGASTDTVPDIGLKKLDNSTKNSTNNTNSSNFTTNGKRKTIESPKTNIEEAQPTYTLVYAIIGIAIVSILFNSSYMKRDD